LVKSEALVAVVIPIYKDVPTEQEIVSLTQCLKTLSNYPIVFIAPAKLNFKWYSQFCSDYNVKIELLTFENEYFASIEGYNRLMLSAQFYLKFLSYKYILIYQLDAFVFKDELEYWCKSNYDYIGAPWKELYIVKFIEKYKWKSRISKISIYKLKAIRNYHILKTILYYFGYNKTAAVGNGGFSLRKTRTFYKIATSYKPLIDEWLVSESRCDEPPFNEDVFWCCFPTYFYPLYKLPPVEVASRFALEGSPSEHIDNDHPVLPFGCHAWNKHDTEFWKGIFRGLGYYL
jgi:hypothetical protein